jgi:hypothetical protein
MRYIYDRDLDRVKEELNEQARFERKMWQISICVVIAVIVLVADAIAGGF